MENIVHYMIRKLQTKFKSNQSKVNFEMKGHTNRYVKKNFIFKKNICIINEPFLRNFILNRRSPIFYGKGTAQKMKFSIKGYVSYKPIFFCHEVALDAQLMNFFI